jgi:hypothetical protein
MLDHKDLIFQDSTVRLVHVHPENQTYQKYLGASFLRAMERNANIDCVTTASGVSWTPSFLFACIVLLLSTLFTL